MPKKETLRLAMETLRYCEHSGGITEMKTGADVTFKTRNGYLNVARNGQVMAAHRVAWLLKFGVWPDGDIDHINGDPQDNRLENLREVSKSTNQRNRRLQRNNTTGVNGVYQHTRSKKYVARVKLHGKVKTIGTFGSLADAAAARAEWDRVNGFTERHTRGAR